MPVRYTVDLIKFNTAGVENRRYIFRSLCKGAFYKQRPKLTFLRISAHLAYIQLTVFVIKPVYRVSIKLSKASACSFESFLQFFRSVFIKIGFSSP